MTAIGKAYLTLYEVLPPSQITICFGFSRYIYFAMHLDVHYVTISRYIAKKMYLRKPKRIVIWDGGSTR